MQEEGQSQHCRNTGRGPGRQLGWNICRQSEGVDDITEDIQEKTRDDTADDREERTRALIYVDRERSGDQNHRTQQYRQRE